MKNDLCICCNLFLVRLETELCQASAAYVMTGRIAYLYTVTRMGYDIPHVAFEHRTRLFRMCSNLFSRYCVWGNQSNLQSSIIPRYFILETTFSPHSAILVWLLYNYLFLINIGINADLSLEISSLCFFTNPLWFGVYLPPLWEQLGGRGPEPLAVCRRRMLRFVGLVPWTVVQLSHW